MSRRHRARGTAAAAATDGPAAAPAGRTRGAAPTPAPISPSADVPDWVGPPGSSVANTRDSPALISNRELEASLCRAKCFRCDKCNCPGARDPAGKGDGCTGFSRERGDLAWLRGDHADARQPSAAQLAVLRRPAVSLVVAGKIEKISGENLLCYYRAAATGLKMLGCIRSRSVEGAVPALRKSLAAYFSSGFSDAEAIPPAGSPGSRAGRRGVRGGVTGAPSRSFPSALRVADLAPQKQTPCALEPAASRRLAVRRRAAAGAMQLASPRARLKRRWLWSLRFLDRCGNQRQGETAPGEARQTGAIRRRRRCREASKEEEPAGRSRQAGPAGWRGAPEPSAAPQPPRGRGAVEESNWHLQL